MYSGEIPILRVALLASQLRPGARVWGALGVDSAWTEDQHLLANIFDALNAANYQRGGGKGQKPKPIPRPAELKAKRDKEKRKELLAVEAARRQKEKGHL